MTSIPLPISTTPCGRCCGNTWHPGYELEDASRSWQWCSGTVDRDETDTWALESIDMRLDYIGYREAQGLKEFISRSTFRRLHRLDGKQRITNNKTDV